jgi:zinc protease
MKHLLLTVLLSLSSSVVLAGMSEHAQRARTAGIDVITYHSTVKDVVVIDGALPAGDAMAGKGNIAVPTLAGMMLDRGTKTLDKFAIAEKLDDVGAEISFEVGTQSLGIRARCLTKDLPMVLGLIAQELRSPANQAAEFAKAKQQFLGGLEASRQSSGARAGEAFNRAIFPEGHPNRPHTLDEFVAAGKSATLEEVKAFQAKYYGPARFTLILAGDVNDAAVRAEVTKVFSGWSGGGDYVLPAQPAKATQSSEVTVPLADKPSVTMILGSATGLKYKDPDSLPLRVGTAILGRGFTGRLMGTVRDKEGLTYGISAAMGEDTLVDGNFDISASFAPALLEKGVASTRRELTKWWKDGVTQDELTARKQGIIGSYRVGMATTGGVANSILINIQRGYDVGWLDEYPNAVNALTVTQVNSAIKNHLDPDKMVLVEAGTVPAKN